MNTYLAAPGALAHRLQNQKWPLGGSKMADRVWKGAYPLIFGHSRQLLPNKFFDPITPSMRKVDDRENRKNEKIMSFIVPTNIVASRPPERQPTGRPTACANKHAFSCHTVTSGT